MHYILHIILKDIGHKNETKVLCCDNVEISDEYVSHLPNINWFQGHIKDSETFKKNFNMILNYHNDDIEILESDLDYLITRKNNILKYIDNIKDLSEIPVVDKIKINNQNF